MSDDPIDLRALDPDVHPRAEEMFVNQVMARIASRTSIHAPRMDPLLGVWSYARTVLIAASIVLGAAMAFGAREARVGARGPATVAEAMGVPPEFMARTSLHRRVEHP